MELEQRYITLRFGTWGLKSMKYHLFKRDSLFKVAIMSHMRSLEKCYTLKRIEGKFPRTLC